MTIERELKAVEIHKRTKYFHLKEMLKIMLEIDYN